MCLVLQLFPFHEALLINQESWLYSRLLNYSPLYKFKIVKSFLQKYISNKYNHYPSYSYRAFKLKSQYFFSELNTYLKRGHFFSLFHLKIKVFSKVKLPKDNYSWYFICFIMSAFFKLVFFFLTETLICTDFQICEE